jgi:membrane associated rhomboid family serine protease
VHVLGNAISGTIFASAVQRRIGAGGAALAVLASGVLGNVANAFYYQVIEGEAHRSIGASTAVFGAIGLLAATQLVVNRSGGGRKVGWLELAGPLVGGAALLGALGAGDGHGRTDLGAHAFGFLSGVLIGLFAAWPLRRGSFGVDLDARRGTATVRLGAGAPRWWIQVVLGALATSLVVGSWILALKR